MAGAEPSAVLRHVGTLFGAGVAGGASDGQLLERFRAQRDETAFAVLVARHGPLVMGVCRRALRDPNDADDAFQATFLVLARKAGSIRVDGSLGRWLYGVSRRVAARARADAAKRANRESPGRDMETNPENFAQRELIAALDDEVSRLPDRFRSAIVLCDLAGLTHQAAAEQLRCPVGTIESRLSRGRSRLRDRLTRRGFAPSTVLAIPSAIPSSLSTSTVHAAARAVGVSATALMLSTGVITEMAMLKIKVWTLVVGFVALACGFGVVAAGKLDAKSPPKAGANDEPIVLAAPPKMKPGDTLNIKVLETLPGRPLHDETKIVRPDGTISLGYYGDLKVAGLDRNEIKVKLVERMLIYLPDAILGLEQESEENGKVTRVKIPPVESDRVVVDDSPNYITNPQPPNETARKLDQVLKAIENQTAMIYRSQRPVPATPAINSHSSNQGNPRTAGETGVPSEINPGFENQERRISAIERKLDALIKAVEGMKDEKRK